MKFSKWIKQCWLLKNWKQSLLLAIVVFITTNIPSYYDLYYKFKGTPYLVGDIDEFIFANMDDGKTPTSRQDSLALVSLYICNNADRPVVIRYVEYEFSVGGSNIPAKSVVVNRTDEWLNVSRSQDDLIKIRWAPMLLLNKLRKATFEPGIPSWGYLTFAFRAEEATIASLKKDDFDLTVVIHDYLGKVSKINMKHGIPVIYLGTASVNQIEQSKDGRSDFTYEYNRRPNIP